MPINFKKPHQFTAALVIVFFFGVIGGFFIHEVKSLAGPTAGPEDQGVGNASSAKGSLAVILGGPADTPAATSLFGQLADLKNRIDAISGGSGGGGSVDSNLISPLARITTTFTDGYLGGWSGADARCQAEFGDGWYMCRTSQEILAQSHSGNDNAIGWSTSGCKSTENIDWCSRAAGVSGNVFAISGTSPGTFYSCSGPKPILCCGSKSAPANTVEKCAVDVLASFGDSILTRYDSAGPVLEALLDIGGVAKRVPISLANGTGDSSTAPSVFGSITYGDPLYYLGVSNIWKGNEILRIFPNNDHIVVTRYDTAGSPIGSNTQKVAMGSIDDGDPNTNANEDVDVIKKVVEGSGGYTAAAYTLLYRSCTVVYKTCPAETPCNGFPGGTVFQMCPESYNHDTYYKTAIVDPSGQFVNADIRKQLITSYKGGFILNDWRGGAGRVCFAGAECYLQLYTYTNSGVETKWTDIPAINTIFLDNFIDGGFKYVIGSKHSSKVYLFAGFELWQIDMTTMIPTKIIDNIVSIDYGKIRDDWMNRANNVALNLPSLNARGGQMYSLDAGDTKHAITYYEPQTPTVGTVKSLILDSSGLVVEGPSQTTEVKWSAAQDLTTDEQLWIVYDVPDGSVRTRRIDLSSF